MQTTSLLRGHLAAPLALALIASSLLSSPANARLATQQAGAPSEWATAPASVRAAAHRPIDELLFDEPGDGALWARGSSFKARFDGNGATIVPFFGSDAPRDYPLALQATASLGGHALAQQADAQATRAGDTISIDHGAFVEEYELALRSLEQRFVFPSLRGSGDLVLRIAFDSEFAPTDLGASLRFENERGRVDYGAAFAIDASGRRLALDSAIVDGAIQLVVPAAFVASASLPLTIDPLITTFPVATSGLDELDPDVAYDVSSDRWCVVWTSVWSNTDHDVIAELFSGAGVSDTTVSIDLSSDVWTTPRIANNNASDVFLVCASYVTPAGLSSIRGRLIYALPKTTGNPFLISPPDGIYRNGPDVGGDPYIGTPSYFCVTWQRSVNATDVDVEMRLVEPDGTLHGNPVYLEHDPSLAELPRISSSVGLDNGGIAPVWTVVWQSRASATDHDIYGAQVRWNGAIVHAKFPITTDASDDTAPVVSTVLDPVPPAIERPYLVVFQRKYGQDNNVYGVLLQGALVLDQVDTTAAFEGAPINDDQYAPTVDSDGAQFLVGYVERATPTSTDGNVWISNYYTSGNKLLSLSVRRSLAGSPTDDSEIALCSMAGAGGPRQHYFDTWVHATTGNRYDVEGALWDGASGGWISGFCNGDGSGTPCPCGNNGVEGSGCANSVSPTGAALSATGDASVTADTLVFHASGMPPTATCLFFQGTATAGGSVGVPFGDGKRCVLGAITRVGFKASVAGAATYPELGELAISVQGHVPYAGATRYYQAWYRDPAAFCTNATVNMTNGLAVIWTP